MATPLFTRLYQSLGSGVTRITRAFQNLPFARPPLYGRTPVIHIDREKEVVYEEMRVYTGISSLRHSPYHDNFTQETMDMRLTYRRWAAEPSVKASLAGKVYAVASLGLQVRPSDKNSQRSQEKADFVRYCMHRSLVGFTGMVYETVLPALMDGWSVCEPVWTMEERGRFRGKRVIADYKSKDSRYLIPRVDQFRNIIGLYNPRGNYNHLFDPAHYVIFTHLPLFRNPTGTSDLRAVYRAMQLLPAVWKLRAIFLDKYTGPFIKAKVRDKGIKNQMAAELAKARADGFIVLDADSEVEVLDLVTRGTSDFQAGLDDLRKEVATALEGAFLHRMTAADPNSRGDSQTQEGTADLVVWWLAEQLAAVWQHQLVPNLIDYNYGSLEDLPLISLEAVDPRDVIAQLGIDEALDRMGIPTSVEDLRDRAKRSPPKSLDDSTQQVKKTATSPPPQANPNLPQNPFLDGRLNFSEWATLLTLSRERVDDAADMDVQLLDSFAETTKFTGQRKDRSGRTFCYQNGVRVPCTKTEPTKAVTDKPPENPPTPDNAPKVLPQVQIPYVSPVDYNHSDPKHPIAQMIQADAAGLKLVGDFHDQFVSKEKAYQKAEEDYKTVLFQATQLLDGIIGNAAEFGKQEAELKAQIEPLRKARQDAFNERVKAADDARNWLAENVKPVNPSTIPIDLSPAIHDYHAKAIKDGASFAQSITGGVDKPVYIASVDTDRAYYSENDGSVNLSEYVKREPETDDDTYTRDTTVHEIGHHIEKEKPGLRLKAHEFLAYRCGTEPFVQLNKVAGGGYSPYEVGRKDNFDNVFDRGANAYYVGKRYGGTTDFATEVISMGMEQLSRDPIKFAERDPEYFHWLITVLRS